MALQRVVMVSVQCDGCSDVCDASGHDGKEARSAAKKVGWKRIAKFDGDYCPRCVERLQPRRIRSEGIVKLKSGYKPIGGAGVHK